jgi:hypothetical protein
VDENKVKGYALCMIQDPVEPNLIFVGTEHGLWISLDNGVLISNGKMVILQFPLMTWQYRKEKLILLLQLSADHFGYWMIFVH